MTRALLIMGPTASGKSALALALAEALDGEIVNADAMQVYADLRVLTARPTPAEEAAAPHHLYGVVDGASRHSVGRWLDDATAAITTIRARGKVAIVVGGTGLYFKALTEGFREAPPTTEALHEAFSALLQAEGPRALYARLAAADPETAARLNPADTVRILRALAVHELTGRPQSAFQDRGAPRLDPGSWQGVLLWPDRADLYAAIEARFGAMLEAGALKEAERLAARALDPSLPVMKAHGAPALMRCLAGELTLAEAGAIAVRDTRRYAKRQFTWMAGQLAGWPRLPEPALESRRAHILAARALLDRADPVI